MVAPAVRRRPSSEEHGHSSSEKLGGSNRDARTNRRIKAREVRVVGPEGEQLGVLPIEQALARAQELGMDLVEVSPMAKPPVCKIMDYGKFKYLEKKKQNEAKKKQVVVQLKEVKLRPRTEEHDYDDEDQEGPRVPRRGEQGAHHRHVPRPRDVPPRARAEGAAAGHRGPEATSR